MGVAAMAQWGSLPPGPRWPQTAQLAARFLRPLERVEQLRDRVRRAPGASHRPVRGSVTMAPARGTPIVVERR